MPRYNKPDWLMNPADLWGPWVQLGSGVPMFTIPGNKVCTISPKLTGYDPAAMAGKGGYTHFQDTSAPTGIQLNWFYNTIFNGRGFSEGSPYRLAGKTLDQIRTVVNSLTTTSFYMDELAEGYWGMPVDAPEYVYFLQAIAEKHANPTLNPNNYPLRYGGTYGSFASAGQWNYYEYMPGTGGSPLAPNHANFKQYLQTQSKARELSGRHFSAFAPLGIGTNVKNYIDRPDYQHIYYLKKFEMESICLGYGRVGGVGPGFVVYVDWPKLESLGNPYSAAYYHSRRITDPDGLIVNPFEEHPQVDYDIRVGTGFVCGFVLGHGWVQFDVPSRFGSNPKTKANTQNWVPNVSGTPSPTSYPATTFADHYFTDMFRGLDAASEAAYYYTQMASTEGEKWEYGSYRFEGSETWINPNTDQGVDNGPTTTILEHASAFDGPYARGASVRRGRPDFMLRKKGSTVHYYVFDPALRKGKSENLILKLSDSKQVPVTIKGGVLYPGYDTL